MAQHAQRSTCSLLRPLSAMATLRHRTVAPMLTMHATDCLAQLSSAAAVDCCLSWILGAAGLVLSSPCNTGSLPDSSRLHNHIMVHPAATRPPPPTWHGTQAAAQRRMRSNADMPSAEGRRRPLRQGHCRLTPPLPIPCAAFLGYWE